MSNTRHLTRINPGSGQRSRPKHTWRGYRPPRSAKKRLLQLRAFQRVQKALKASQIQIKMPDTEGETKVG